MTAKDIKRQDVIHGETVTYYTYTVRNIAPSLLRFSVRHALQFRFVFSFFLRTDSDWSPSREDSKNHAEG